jgi:hypothetical protein
MVINMTNAVLTNTQAVSPVFTADAAATGVAVTAVAPVVATSCARAGKAPANVIPIPIIPAIHPALFTLTSPSCCCFKFTFTMYRDRLHNHIPCQSLDVRETYSCNQFMVNKLCIK